MTMRTRCTRCHCAISLSFADCCRQRVVPDDATATLWAAHCTVCGRQLRLPFLVDFVAVMVAITVAGAVALLLGQITGSGWLAGVLALPLLWLVAGAGRYCFVSRRRVL